MQESDPHLHRRYLRPVSFRYKSQSGQTHFGLVAGEVDRVTPELMARDLNDQVEAILFHMQR